MLIDASSASRQASISLCAALTPFCHRYMEEPRHAGETWEGAAQLCAWECMCSSGHCEAGSPSFSCLHPPVCSYPDAHSCETRGSEDLSHQYYRVTMWFSEGTLNNGELHVSATACLYRRFRSSMCLALTGIGRKMLLSVNLDYLLASDRVPGRTFSLDFLIFWHYWNFSFIMYVS